MREFIRLFKLCSAHPGWMLAGAVLSLLSLLANVSLLAVSGWFITMMALAGISGITVNYFTPGAIVRGLAIFRTVGRYGERLVTHEATFRIIASLRVYFYQKLMPLLPYYQMDLRSGDLLARVQEDIDRLDNFYLRILLPVFVALTSVPLVCFGISLISVELAIVVALVLCFAGLIIPLANYYGGRRYAGTKSRLAARHKLELIDATTGIKDLLVYGVSDQWQYSLNRLSDVYLSADYKLRKQQAMSNLVTFLLMNSLVFAVFWLLIPVAQIHGAGTPQLSPELVASMVLLVLVSGETVMSLPLAVQLLPETLSSARRLFEITDKTPPAREAENPSITALEAEKIEFDSLSFRYPEQQEQALHNIELTINKGEKIAVLGPSGAGKSTLIQMLFGFWPVANGQLKIDGTDINRIPEEVLREHFAQMSQQGHLFHATIADNLRLANPNATEDEMLAVLESVGLSEFVDSLELGLKTWLGDTGCGLSGGQKQRLQLAQVMLKPARLMTLDEPTRGLDNLTEQRVIKAIFQHLEQTSQSLVMITHKPVMLQQMDKIILMDEGRIIAQDTHDNLFKNNEYYRDLLDYF